MATPRTDTRRKRLLAVTTTLPGSPRDPTPRFVLDLCRALAKRYDTTILAPAQAEAPTEEIRDGVRIFRYRYAPTRSLERLTRPGGAGGVLDHLRAEPLLWCLVPLLLAGLARRLRRLLRQERFECVHAHWLVPHALLQALFFSTRHYPPFIATSYGADVHRMKNAPLGWAFRLIVQRSAALTAVSPSLADALKVRLGSPTVPVPVEIIPMGIDLAAFHPDRRDTDWAARSRLVPPVLLFVGRLVEKKGVTYLLRALAAEPMRHAPGTLAIVGDGPLRESLIRETVALGLSDRVRFLGALSENQLAPVFASADIFCAPFVVAPDGDADGMPAVLGEAAASGLAIVTTEVVSSTDAVSHERSGLIVAPADVEALSIACHRLATDATLRRRLGAAARTGVLHLGWDAVAARYARIIERVSEPASREPRQPG
jgi:glycosyltransferase involved in cell wall biosynthesis